MAVTCSTEDWRGRLETETLEGVERRKARVREKKRRLMKSRWLGVGRMLERKAGQQSHGAAAYREGGWRVKGKKKTKYKSNLFLWVWVDFNYFGVIK